MDSSTSSPLEYSLSQKQLELLDTFESLVAQYGINLFINVRIKECNEPISFDVEHDEMGGFVGIGLYHSSSNSHYWYTDVDTASRVDWGSFKLIAHNGISDLDCLRLWGIDVENDCLVWDTMLMGHISDSSLKSYGLKDMAKRDLSVEYPSYDDIVGKRTLKQAIARLTLDKQPARLVQLYNCMDCFVTAKIYQLQVSKLSIGLETSVAGYFNTVEKPLAPILADMSNRGIRVDLEYLRGLKTELEAQQAPIKDGILNELGPINLNSPKQLLGALNAKEIYPTFKGKPSTDKRALSLFSSNRIVEKLLAFSEIETLLASFVYPYLSRNQETVHPFFNQVGTRTGRLSCSNPNLLQIPRRTENGKRVRKMFIPRDGFVLGDCDFGQIEPRLMAHLSKDAAMCQMFNDGIDFHTFTAERLGITRDKAKVLNLSVGYLATGYSVGQQLGCAFEEAEEIIESWWALFPGLRRWEEKLVYDSTNSGYCTTLFGRRIKIDGLDSTESFFNRKTGKKVFPKKEAAMKQLINNIAQASAREVMAKAMIQIENTRQCDEFSETFGLLIQVYDELVFESTDIGCDANMVRSCMEHSVNLDVPLTVDCKTGMSWSECH